MVVSRKYTRVLGFLLLGSITVLQSPMTEAQYLGDFLLNSANESQLRIVGKLQQQILANTAGQPPHNPLRLAQAFASSAAKHGLDAGLLAAIGAVESGYFVGAVNAKTNDFGLMQVNAYNIKAMKLDKRLLLTDIEYSIEAGAVILAYFKRRYAAREPKTWFCRYNVGTRKLSGRLRFLCQRYVQKVERAR